MVTRKKARTGEEFIFCNGHSAQSIPGLKKEIKKLTAEEFSFHVNNEKNDFYNWIKDCIKPDVAEQIRDLKDCEKILAALK
ncbi:MAG: hypothetical protein ACOC32_00935 [Nanoarchaeota archaeon]